ncbi:MAG TPA: hypothetical protein VJ695_08550 [Nitrososphaera sp.]|nr:hypothetical protein [Nitrososphaera sp.]
MRNVIRLRKRQEITERVKGIRRPQSQQQSRINHQTSQEQHDSLWYQTPDVGLEGLVATIRSTEKLHAALLIEITKKREKVR